MALKSRDKHFRLPKISMLDFKTLEMDRVMTGLFARVAHLGHESRLADNTKTIDTFLGHFLSQPEKFKDFAKFQEVARGWLETHLLDLVHRGKGENQKVAAPRPLHGNTYRFRNPYHCRDYGAAQHIYESLWHARGGIGRRALDRLKSFFFQRIDPNTGKEDPNVVVDVETQALLSLTPEDVSTDAPKAGSREVTPPLCVGAADLLADDILRLLQYQAKIPRTVMVEYLKILLAFHLALYHLRLFKLVPELVRRKGLEPTCEAAKCPMRPGAEEKPNGDCPYLIGLFLDVQNQPGTRISELAETSAELHYRRIPTFVRAYFLTKKMDEFAQHMLQFGRLQGGANRALSVSQVLRLLDDCHTVDREQYFGARLLSLKEDMAGEDDTLDPEIQATLRLGLDQLNTYIECLMALRGDFQRSFIVKALDALLLKNRPGALLAQARSARAPRRFILDSRLLEVLLQLAVLRYDAGSGRYFSEEIQIDRLLAFLRDRYGLYIDALPIGEGFGEPSIADREALRQNKAAFKNKLREIGFFQDLSDAYVTQHVTPRYRIGAEPAVPAGGAA
ncbi:MAG: hypothetical protein KA191_11975 [Verrucomicrobia bacterium]|jgi:hypothetical protein|nr:hypothetical protein [Verrucomicrobiota bacterium]OQC68111.1 MAG: hypothetical protein BWX48_00206 [Verrucomicrobia bacterium ADurb.Bin006]NMD22363.1 hypothetical protein [Verrucomicrobiota bacterium]HOA62130.1 hypothetical protein [Verrucomicrobiota bacterium]HOF48695.1 hypothetical protein [Verrucomicrobiota bacterium]